MPSKDIKKEVQSLDLAALFASLEKINHRLDRLEGVKPAGEATAQWSDHASLDKFNVVEAIVEEVFERHQKEKACTFEPDGKPCDHCSMCNSRGF